MKKQILKLLLALSIVAFAASMLAVSCGKTGGGGGGGNGDDKPLVATTNLVLSTGGVPWVKQISNTLIMRAATLGTLTLLSDADDDDRGIFDVIDNTKHQTFITINYPGATAALIFIYRAHVTKDTITMPAITAYTLFRCSSSESGDNALALAPGGGTCRLYAPDDSSVVGENYLGTVFNNTKTTSHARVTMYCSAKLASNATITDTTVFPGDNNMQCYLGIVNNGLGAGVTIDDAWVSDSGSTTEMEFYAIAIDVSGKTIEQFSGLKKADFYKAMDNAAFKQLLRNNPWGEVKFKMKLVTTADFAALP